MNFKTMLLKGLRNFAIVTLLCLCITSTYAQFEIDAASSDFVEIPEDTTFITPSGRKLENIGGFSGIDYSKTENLYYVITDAAKGKARYYKVAISIEDGVHYEFLEVCFIKNSAVRGEVIRVFPGGLFLTDERRVRFINGSFVYKMDHEGRITQIALPEKFQKNMASNSGFEGLALASKAAKLYLALERPMPQGPDRYLTNILQYDLNDLNAPPVVYDYPLQRQKKGNGISELMVFNDTTLLVIERDYVKPKNYIRIYSVTPEKTTVLLKPKLLFSFDNIHQLGGRNFKVDNIEGMTLSPKRDYLVLISDNNFGNGSKHSPTQIIFLKIKNSLPN